MERNKLISYSFYYRGHYDKITRAIENNEDIMIDRNINAITILDEIYPKSFLDLKSPPYVLYYKGNLDLLKGDKIGVVGSRKPCDYSIKCTKNLILNNQDKVIVSGLAKGIDAYAHYYAKKTIGILGCGIDYIYPKCNYELIKRVERNGLILSEYPLDTKPYAYHFPFRNRLIAALSKVVYVMQSNIKSGTVTTVNEALELGKEIRVLPYDAFDLNGIGNNTLINEGASMILYEEIAF